MPRWEPGTRDRLFAAAIDLFIEQGYDDTTIAQITERAGLTRSAFFRYYADKREVLVAGHEALSQKLAEGVIDAPADAGPLEAVAAGLERICSAMGPTNRQLGRRLTANASASAELHERDALKRVSLATAMSAALIQRGIDEPAAQLAAEMGVLAFQQGFAQWTEPNEEPAGELAPLALAALQRLRNAGASLNLGN